MANTVQILDREVDYQTRASVFRVGAEMAKNNDVAAALAKIAEGYEALAQSVKPPLRSDRRRVRELTAA